MNQTERLATIEKDNRRDGGIGATDAAWLLGIAKAALPFNKDHLDGRKVYEVRTELIQGLQDAFWSEE